MVVTTIGWVVAAVGVAVLVMVAGCGGGGEGALVEPTFPALHEDEGARGGTLPVL